MIFDDEKTFCFLFTDTFKPPKLNIRFGDFKNPHGKQIFLNDRSFISNKKPPKYLGFHLDRLMDGSAHRKIISLRMNSKLKLFKRLGSKSCGLAPVDMLHIFYNWGIQALSYALPVFCYSPEHAIFLSKLQKGWLTVVGRFYKNTTTSAQEAMFGVLPADIYIAKTIILKFEKVLRYQNTHPLKFNFYKKLQKHLTLLQFFILQYRTLDFYS